MEISRVSLIAYYGNVHGFWEKAWNSPHFSEQIQLFGRNRVRFLVLWLHSESCSQRHGFVFRGGWGQHGELSLLSVLALIPISSHFSMPSFVSKPWQTGVLCWASLTLNRLLETSWRQKLRQPVQHLPCLLLCTVPCSVFWLMFEISLFMHFMR